MYVHTKNMARLNSFSETVGTDMIRHEDYP